MDNFPGIFYAWMDTIDASKSGGHLLVESMGYKIKYWDNPPEVEEEEARKYKQYKFRSDLAIWLVIIGFGFQLVGNLL